MGLIRILMTPVGSSMISPQVSRTSTRPKRHHGHPGYAGYAWYRIRVNLEPGSDALALLMPMHVEDAYEVYLDGRKIGSYGKLIDPHLTYNQQPKLFPIPAEAITPGQPATLAIRFWSKPWEALPHRPNLYGGLRGVPLIGPSNLLRVFYQSVPGPFDDSWVIGGLFLSYPVQPSLYLGIGLVSIFLFFFSREKREYLWAGVALVGRGLLIAAIMVEIAGQIPEQLGDVAQQIALLLSVFSMPLAAMYLLSVPRPRWQRANLYVFALFLIAGLDQLGIMLGWLPSNETVNAIDSVLAWVPRTALAILLVLIAIDGIRNIGRKAWLVMIPGVLFAAHMLLFMFFPGVFTGVGILDPFLSAGVPVSVLFVFLIRFTEQQRENGRMVADLHQAREVQRLMIPEQWPHVPWLSIECEYCPSQEVGGDFFQIIPDPSDGSLLIVAGDVAGKGLQAGMLVAMLVGAVRNESVHTQDPLELLKTLNAGLCERQHAQATCLALRIEPDGSSTLASAGHLPPYLNGCPLEIEGALPLGMMEDAEFSVLAFQMSASDGLVIFSDGVVEARNAESELLGFERLAALTTQPAAAISRAAQSWGQNDDITVLTLTFAPVEVPHVSTRG
jgi:Stage II sporulation protein E (SpoIIE)